MNKKNIIAKLKDDTHYYGDFGKKFLSNSDIMTLLKNPLAFGLPSKPTPAFLVGSYFHTAVGPGGGAGSDSGEDSQSSGPQAANSSFII